MPDHSAAELPLFIDGQNELDQLCETIAASSHIALDTEFVRTRTYAPHLGLVQVAAGGTAVCVDPLADLDYSQLWPLLYDTDRVVIMHSATQDLEVMWFHTGDLIHNLIDTQLCAALLGYPPQIGYAGLVADLAGTALSKEQTRTDWTRRPLSAEQIDYAAKDVVYLDGMHTIDDGQHFRAPLNPGTARCPGQKVTNQTDRDPPGVLVLLNGCAPGHIRKSHQPAAMRLPHALCMVLTHAKAPNQTVCIALFKQRPDLPPEASVPRQGLITFRNIIGLFEGQIITH